MAVPQSTLVLNSSLLTLHNKDMKQRKLVYKFSGGWMGSGVKDDNDSVSCFQCSFVYLVIEMCSVVPNNTITDGGSTAALYC